MVKKSINTLVEDTSRQLKLSGIKTARLDVELLLAHVLKKDRSWLHAHGDELLTDKQVDDFTKLIERRAAREPVAYLVGKKEFYGRDFFVTPDVLIPRPETESLVTLTLSLLRVHPLTGEKTCNLRVVDVGTGSGCVGLTLAAELPEQIAELWLVDISPQALAVAKRNHQALLPRRKVYYHQSSLLDMWQPDAVNKPLFDCIIANLPYVDRSWERSPETDYEPALALFADEGGCELIYRLIQQAQRALASAGYLLLEADPTQHRSIVDHAESHGFHHIETQGYAIALQKT